MANVKITDLTEDTTPANGDWVETVDISAGASKKVTRTNFFLAPPYGADSVSDAALIYGKLRSRQGGNASNWAVAGTNTYDTSGTNVFMQCGVIGTGTGSATTVTFPTAFSQKPVVVLSTYGGNAGDTALTQNAFAEISTVSTTQFTCYTFNTGASQSDQAVAWIAIGV